MSLFCLVHGSTQSASCWDLLIPKLEQRGHDVVRMNLPTNEPAASATRYANAIAAVIPADRGDAVVVAHSASGLFLPLVPGNRRVQRLVFLAAVIPQIGQSLLDQVNDDPQMLNPGWIGKDPTKDQQIRFTFSLSRLFSGGEQVGFEHNKLDECAASNARNLSLERLAGRTLFLHPLPR
jgi:hypothetical protein